MTTGIDSLLNEAKLSFTRGQLIRFYDGDDNTVMRGRYVMASSVEGYIVVNVGGRYGRPKVVPISRIIRLKKDL